MADPHTIHGIPVQVGDQFPLDIVVVTSFRPAMAFPIQEIVQDELDERGWDRAELARRMCVTFGEMHDLMTSSSPISRRIAERLEMAFGASAQFWLNIDTSYHEWRQAQDAASERS